MLMTLSSKCIERNNDLSEIEIIDALVFEINESSKLETRPSWKLELQSICIIGPATQQIHSIWCHVALLQIVNNILARKGSPRHALNPRSINSNQCRKSEIKFPILLRINDCTEWYLGLQFCRNKTNSPTIHFLTSIQTSVAENHLYLPWRSIICYSTITLLHSAGHSYYLFASSTSWLEGKSSLIWLHSMENSADFCVRPFTVNLID